MLFRLMFVPVKPLNKIRMTTKRLISALLLVIFSVALFASCTPDSIADDSNTYDNFEGIKKTDAAKLAPKKD